jgi:hypothetical protein
MSFADAPSVFARRLPFERPQSPDSADLPGATVRRAEQACDRFEAACKAGQRPRIEEHLPPYPRRNARPCCAN